MNDFLSVYLNAKAIHCNVVNCEPRFRAKGVAGILKYNDTKKALANKVDNDEQKNFEYLIDEKARVDLTSPWAIMIKIHYIFINRVLLIVFWH